MRHKNKNSRSLPLLLPKQRKYPHSKLIEKRKEKDVKKNKQQKLESKTKKLPIVTDQNLKQSITSINNYIHQSSDRYEFHSFTNYCETKLRETISICKMNNMSKPNILLTSVCNHLLLQLSNVIPEYKTFIKIIASEISNAIYLDWNHQYYDTPESNSDTLKSLTPYFSIYQSQKLQLETAEIKVAAFCGVGISIGQLSEKRQNLLNSTVSTWQSMVVRRCFENWRMSISMRKRQLTVLLKRRYRLWFDAWRRKNVISRLNRAAKSNIELDKEVNNLEECCCELRDQKEILINENKRLKMELRAASNVTLRQSDAEISLRNELNVTKNQMLLYKNMLQDRMNEDNIYIKNTKDKWKNQHLIHQLYQENKDVPIDDILNNVETFITENNGNKSLIANEIVTKFANYHLRKCRGNDWKLNNFHEQLRDGEVWSAILTQVCTAVDDEESQRKEAKRGENENGEGREAVIVLAHENISEKKNERKNESGDNMVSLDEISLNEVKKNETFFDKVRFELDVTKRSVMNCEEFLKLNVPIDIITPEDMNLSNVDSNFLMMSYLFLYHPRLQTSHKKEKKESINHSEMKTGGERVVAVAEDEFFQKCKSTYNMKKKWEKKQKQYNKSHQLYLRFSRIVSNFLISEMSGRLRGKPSTVRMQEEKREMKAFTSLNFQKIKDLLLEEGEDDNDDNDDNNNEKQKNPQVYHLSKYLGTVYKDIKKIFRAYGAMGSGAASSISSSEFDVLIKDIKICDKMFTKDDVHLIFLRCNWQVDTITGKLKTSGNRSLTKLEFVECLVRCAYSRFHSSTTTTLKDCVEILFNKHLLPFAQRSDVDAFRKRIHEPQIQLCFQKYETQLKFVFIEKAGTDGVIQLDEFTNFLKKKGVVNSQLPAKKIMKIFNCVQNNSDNNVGGGDDDIDDDDDDETADCEMTFDEFLESLAAVACFYMPDPYICLEQRVEVFFLTKVIDHITPSMLRQFKARAESARKL